MFIQWFNYRIHSNIDKKLWITRQKLQLNLYKISIGINWYTIQKHHMKVSSSSVHLCQFHDFSKVILFFFCSKLWWHWIFENAHTRSLKKVTVFGWFSLFWVGFLIFFLISRNTFAIKNIYVWNIRESSYIRLNKGIFIYNRLIYM